MPQFERFSPRELDEYIWSHGERLPDFTTTTDLEMLVSIPNHQFHIGEHVTQVVSSATGRILWQEDDTIGLVDVEGAFDGEHQIVGNDTGTVGTPCGFYAWGLSYTLERGWTSWRANEVQTILNGLPQEFEDMLRETLNKQPEEHDNV